LAINFLAKLTIENRFYFPFQLAEQIEFENGFSQFFPQTQSLVESFWLEYRINRISKMEKKKTILEGFLTFDGKVFQILLQSFEVIPASKSEFNKLIERIYQIIKDEYVEITFFSHGRTFMPTLYFNGRFNEKVLELVFRNAFYILLNMKKLLTS
jgi:hypothetical protein